MTVKKSNAFRRTDKVIEDAFMKLCKKKGFDKVTVKDIIDEAGISKNTFYQHFQDKYELADIVHKNFADHLTQSINSIYFNDEKNLFDYPKEDREKILHELVEKETALSYDTLAGLEKIVADGKDTGLFFKEAYYSKYMNSRHNENYGQAEKEIGAELYSSVRKALYTLGNKPEYQQEVTHRAEEITCQAMLFALGIKSYAERQELTELLLNRRENAMRQKN